MPSTASFGPRVIVVVVGGVLSDRAYWARQRTMIAAVVLRIFDIAILL